MKTRFLKLLVSVSLGLTIWAGSAGATGEPKLEFYESVLDFGHVGIDYKIYYNFKFFNAGSAPLEIESVTASCDCSKTSLSSRTLRPGDTAIVRLEFGTENDFGEASKSFTIHSNDPKRPDIKIFYVANVGRWVKGTKPDPIYLFFLPGHKAKTIKIHNTHFSELRLALLDQADDFFSVKLLNNKAERGGVVELEVSGEPFSPGTHNSNFRLEITTPDREEAIILTIPVKMVKY